jgi:hypothetical protein
MRESVVLRIKGEAFQGVVTGELLGLLRFTGIVMVKLFGGQL